MQRVVGDGVADGAGDARRYELRDGVRVSGERDFADVAGRVGGDDVREHGSSGVQPGRSGEGGDDIALAGYELLAAGGADAERQQQPGDDAELQFGVAGDGRDRAERIDGDDDVRRVRAALAIDDTGGGADELHVHVLPERGEHADGDDDGERPGEPDLEKDHFRRMGAGDEGGIGIRGEHEHAERGGDAVCGVRVFAAGEGERGVAAACAERGGGVDDIWVRRAGADGGGDGAGRERDHDTISDDGDGPGGEHVHRKSGEDDRRGGEMEDPARSRGVLRRGAGEYQASAIATPDRSRP